jgi:hypothetical protein
VRRIKSYVSKQDNIFQLFSVSKLNAKLPTRCIVGIGKR